MIQGKNLMAIFFVILELIGRDGLYGAKGAAASAPQKNPHKNTYPRKKLVLLPSSTMTVV